MVVVLVCATGFYRYTPSMVPVAAAAIYTILGDSRLLAVIVKQRYWTLCRRIRISCFRKPLKFIRSISRPTTTTKTKSIGETLDRRRKRLRLRDNETKRNHRKPNSLLYQIYLYMCNIDGCIIVLRLPTRLFQKFSNKNSNTTNR